MNVYKLLPQVEAAVKISSSLPRKSVGLRLLSKVHFHEKLPPHYLSEESPVSFTCDFFQHF